MKITVLFLTVLFPFVNYYVYHLLKDHELGYEKRREQGVHPLLRLFKVMENIALGSAVLYIVISFFFGGPREFSIYILCIGTLISSAGIILLYYSRKELGKNFSPCHSAHLPMKYVDTGAYKYMRHPIYIANLLTFLGIVILNFNIVMILSFCFLCLFYFVAIVGENRKLKEIYPESFPGKLIFKTLVDEEEFKEFTRKYIVSCTKRKLLLNFEPDYKEFQNYDQVIGVYKNQTMVAGYVINSNPTRCFSSVDQLAKKEILEKMTGSYCEVVAVWNSSEISKIQFNAQVWTMMAWDTLCMDTKFIFGCCLQGHAMKSFYTFLAPKIVIQGKKYDDLTVFYYSREKFFMTFFILFFFLIPRTLLTKGFK